MLDWPQELFAGNVERKSLQELFAGISRGACRAPLVAFSAAHCADAHGADGARWDMGSSSCLAQHTLCFIVVFSSCKVDQARSIETLSTVAGTAAAGCSILQETVRSLKQRACAAFGVDTEKIEIWDFFHNNKYASLESQLDKDLEEARILDDQPILLDDKVLAAGVAAAAGGEQAALSLPAVQGCC
jgi:hypothetical protein